MPDSTDMAIEIGRIGDRHVGKKASDPRSEMLFEDLPLRLDLSGKLSTDQPGHNFAENGRVVFGLTMRLDTLDAERAQVLAQARQRALVEKAGKIIRPIGQQFASADANKEIEKLPRDAVGAGLV